MSRTLTDLESDIEAAHAADADLAGLNTTSATGIYATLKHFFAVCCKLIYDMFDVYKSEVRAIAYSSIVGKPEWYVQLAQSWSYLGTNIIINAAVKEIGTKVLLKVAKTTSGVTTNLTTTELQAFTNYILANKVCGTNISIISQTADLVSAAFKIQYSGNSATIKSAIITGFQSYVTSLPFNTKLSKGLITQMLLNIPGVLDAYVDDLSVDGGLGYYTSVVGNDIDSDAGYWEIGVASGNPLINVNMYL